MHRDGSPPSGGGASPDFVPTSGKVLSLAAEVCRPERSDQGAHLLRD